MVKLGLQTLRIARRGSEAFQMKKYKPCVFTACLLIIALITLNACGRENGPEMPEDETIEAGDETAGMPEDEPEAAPEDNGLSEKTVWDILGEDAEEFAASFKAEDVLTLDYIFYGVGGAEEYATKDTAKISAVFDALEGIRVVKETDEVADDFEDQFLFKMKDGNTISIRFNMHNLEADDKYYLLEYDTALWTAAEDIASAREALPGNAGKETAENSDETKPAITPEDADKPAGEEAADGDPAGEGPSDEVFESGSWKWTRTIHEDGSTDYIFNDEVFLALPAEWSNLVEMEVEGDYIGFYHIKSNEAYREEGYEGGGWLCSLSYSDNTDFRDMPSYAELGTAGDKYYFLALPSDVQGYMDDGPIWDEWTAVMSAEPYVENNSHVL